jgi:hypothetical protein
VTISGGSGMGRPLPWGTGRIADGNSDSVRSTETIWECHEKRRIPVIVKCMSHVEKHMVN